MSMTTIRVSEARATAWADHARDLLEVCKPRVTAMVLVTVALSMFVASGGHPDLLVFFHTILGTTLVACSSGAGNQWLERDSDRAMARTANRPLPAGRLLAVEVFTFGTTTLIAGLAYLILTVGWVPAVWAAATWLVYVCFYTPMKAVSSWNTPVGAVSGATPVLIGWTATNAPMDWRLLAMFLMLFVWQFPHFISIAWIYRQQYGKAGLRMITVTDPSGRDAGRYAWWCAIVVIGVSLLPMLANFSVVYLIFMTALGIYQAVLAWRFRQCLTDSTARKLLTATIIYLPLALGMMAIHTVF